MNLCCLHTKQKGLNVLSGVCTLCGLGGCRVFPGLYIQPQREYERLFIIWKTQQWPQVWKRSVFIPIPKKSNAKECSSYHTIALFSFVAPLTAACQASLSITSSHSLLELMSIESVMPSSHLILCHPLLFLPPIPPSIRVFSNESTPCIRWPKYWSFSFSISPSNEYSGLISFRMDWLDLLAVQGTLKSLLQHHSSKASILRCSAFFIYAHICTYN